MSTEITSTQLWPALEQAGNYSQAVRVGNTIHVSGTMGLDAEGRLVSDVNMTMQLRQTYSNLEATLGRFGASLANVVSETVYVSSLEQARVARVLDQAYAHSPAPARTLVEVSALALPTAMVSIACIAVV